MGSLRFTNDFVTSRRFSLKLRSASSRTGFPSVIYHSRNGQDTKIIIIIVIIRQQLYAVVSEVKRINWVKTFFFFFATILLSSSFPFFLFQILLRVATLFLALSSAVMRPRGGWRGRRHLCVYVSHPWIDRAGVI